MSSAAEPLLPVALEGAGSSSHIDLILEDIETQLLRVERAASSVKKILGVTNKLLLLLQLVA